MKRTFINKLELRMSVSFFVQIEKDMYVSVFAKVNLSYPYLLFLFFYPTKMSKEKSMVVLGLKRTYIIAVQELTATNMFFTFIYQSDFV